MACIQEVRIPESHRAELTEMMLAKKASKKSSGFAKTTNGLKQSTVVYTDATMMNRVPADLSLLTYHDYSGKVIGSYPPTIGRNRAQGFDHKADVTPFPDGSVGCVVYSGMNHPSGVECAWLMAWEHPFNSTADTVKIYVETGLVAKYQPSVIDWDKIKQKLDASTNTSYYKDQGTGAEASAQITYGDTADVTAVFKVAN